MRACPQRRSPPDSDTRAPGNSEPYVHPYPEPDEGRSTRNAIDQAFSKRPAEPAPPVTTAETAETTPDVHISAENVDFGG